MILAFALCLAAPQEPSPDLIFEPPAELSEWERLLRRCENEEELAWVSSSVLIPFSRLDCPEERQSESVERILTWLLLEGEGGEDSALRHRLRGWVSPEGYQLCATVLLGNGAPEESDMRTALEIILDGPWSETRDFHQALALQQALPNTERSRLLRKWLEAEGRTAVLVAANALLSEGNEPLLLSLLQAWDKVWKPKDVSFLLEMIEVSSDGVDQSARMLLARKTQDVGLRNQLFFEAQSLEANRRDAITANLALQGPHSEIAARLAANLQSPDDKQRDYAERFLPGFLKPEELWKEYALRLDPNAHPLARAQRMVSLARMPIQEARTIATEWLLGGGWRSTAMARTVARELAKDSKVDSKLSQLFSIEELPIEVGFPLAIARAEFSQPAREWLRSMSWVGESARELQAIETLAKLSKVSDLPFLLDVARDWTLGSGMRAAAVSGIARHPLGREELQSWLNKSLNDFELLDALVRELALYGTASERKQIRSFVQDFEKESSRPEATEDQIAESLSLRLSLWQSQEARPLLEEQGILELELADEILSAKNLFETGLPDVRRLAGEFPRIHFCARALGANLRRFGEKLSSSFHERIDGAAVAPILHALSALPSGSAWEVAYDLANRSSLEASVLTRSLASLCSQSYLKSSSAYRESLRKLLSAPQHLRAYPWDLSAGLRSADSIAWVLPADRLQRELAIAEIREAPSKKKLELSSRLLLGFTSPSRLLVAARILRKHPFRDSVDQRLAKTVALRLCYRALDWAPTDARPYLELGNTHLKHGERRQASFAFENALRLAPPDSDWFHEAQEGLQASTP